MPRKESEAVPEGNGPVPQRVVSGQPTLEDETWRKIEELLKRCWKAEEMILKSQRLASLEHNAQQPRLAMEADGPADTKTRECTEGAAKAVQAMYGDSFSASRVDPGPKTNSTSFGVKADPPALPCRDDVLIEKGAAAPKSCLSPLEMRTTSAAGGFLPTGKPSTATKTTFNQPPLWLYSIEEQIYGLQFHPPGTAPIPGEINCLLFPPAGGSLRQNPGKIGRSIRRFSRSSPRLAV